MHNCGDATKIIKDLKESNPKLCEIGKCVDFADAAQKVLEQKGIKGTRVRIENAGAIGFDGKSISSNGVHEFIDVNGKVYDNLSTATPKKEFLKRLEVSNPNVKVKTEDF